MFVKLIGGGFRVGVSKLLVQRALAGKAELIVSGDKHLHSLGGEYQGIRIVTPAQAVQLIDR